MPITPAKHFIKCTILCVLFFTFLNVNSCKKDNSKTLAAPTANLDVNLARQWYEATYPTIANNKLTTNSIGLSVQDWSKTFSPYWAKAKQYLIDSLTYIELPALKKGNMAMSMMSTDARTFDFNKSGSLTSLIIVNKKGKFYIYAMTIMADSSYLKGDYSRVNNNTYLNRDKTLPGMFL